MTKLASILALGAFAGVANAECPNACSGHGICVQFDMCQCYRNWQGNDCSQRTCPVGYAHVDSPKGDLDMSGGALSGPDTTVIKLSEVFPMGTTEQYPDALDNEAHFYMECSNKGLCDRKTGECECFDGYDGAACERASCPGGDGGSSQQCSGHGTCHSIARLTEKFSYKGLPLEVRGKVDDDTGAYEDGTQAYYGLWDKNSTRGCACDSPYVGADCSSRACKVGIDPIFSGWAVHNQPMIMIDCKEDIEPRGTFTILFTDALGQTYRTTKLDVDSSDLEDEVTEALLALPNGVVPEVTVKDYSGKTRQDLNDVAFMITFPNNPGARAGLEIDTSDIDCDDFDKADPVVRPNVGFRQVGSNSDIYTYHAADIAFAKNGHKLLYLKSKLVVGDLNEDKLPVVKIEDKLYVVEKHGELTSGGLAFVVLHTPYEGKDVDGDSEEQNKLMKEVKTVGVSLNDDGHISYMILTDTTGTLAASSPLSTGDDLDDQEGDEALNYFTSGDYYLFEFDLKKLEKVADGSPISTTFQYTTEYCIVYVSTTQSSTDTSSTSATKGVVKIGVNLIDEEGKGYVPLEPGGVNCPMGYKNVEFNLGTTAVPVPSRDPDEYEGAGVHIPAKMRHFFLKRENAVSSKYQSTHQATGGAVLQSAYSRITSQTARGTTRVYLTAEKNYQYATRIGTPLSLEAFVGKSEVFVAADGADSGSMGDLVLIGTEQNVVRENWNIAADATDGAILLQNIFTGSGENQVTGNDKRDDSYDIIPDPAAPDADLSHKVTLYELHDDDEGVTTPVEYVLPCSGRGNCDGVSGLCKCFKGYTNDNCDSQSVLFNGKK
jgi:hypothetical protein